MCVFLAAHVMTFGPRRPVLSWMLEIFRAMAMRGPSTTCREEHTIKRFQQGEFGDNYDDFHRDAAPDNENVMLFLWYLSFLNFEYFEYLCVHC